jgi:hypothetical protein
MPYYLSFMPDRFRWKAEKRPTSELEEQVPQRPADIVAVLHQIKSLDGLMSVSHALNVTYVSQSFPDFTSVSPFHQVAAAVEKMQAGRVIVDGVLNPELIIVWLESHVIHVMRGITYDTLSHFDPVKLRLNVRMLHEQLRRMSSIIDVDLQVLKFFHILLTTTGTRGEMIQRLSVLMPPPGAVTPSAASGKETPQ